MTVQFSTAVRIALLDAIEVAVGANARIVFYTGSKPSLCSDAATGTTVATLALTGNSGDWLAPASAAGNVVTKTKSGASSWSAQATSAGTIGYYRIYDSTLTVCHEQGTVTATGGGGDMTVDNPVVAVNQTITVTAKTLTAGNA